MTCLSGWLAVQHNTHSLALSVMIIPMGRFISSLKLISSKIRKLECSDEVEGICSSLLRSESQAQLRSPGSLCQGSPRRGAGAPEQPAPSAAALKLRGRARPPTRLFLCHTALAVAFELGFYFSLLCILLSFSFHVCRVRTVSCSIG